MYLCSSCQIGGVLFCVRFVSLSDFINWKAIVETRPPGTALVKRGLAAFGLFHV